MRGQWPGPDGRAGDDVNDEDAFTALHGRGVGVIVSRSDDPEVAGRATAADFALRTPADVERFLAALARRSPGDGHDELMVDPESRA